VVALGLYFVFVVFIPNASLFIRRVVSYLPREGCFRDSVGVFIAWLINYAIGFEKRSSVRYYALYRWVFRKALRTFQLCSLLLLYFVLSVPKRLPIAEGISVRLFRFSYSTTCFV
jgi:hypothetical protein